MKIKPLHIFGITLIIAFAAYSIGGLKGSITPYVSVQEARQTADRVQVKGNLDKSSLHTDNLGRLIFDLTDLKDGHRDRFTVVFSGQHPANMAMARDVVAMGTWNPAHNCFDADQMNIKCPDKYEAGTGVKPPPQDELGTGVKPADYQAETSVKKD